jgi:hypothetical protein
MHRRRDKFGLFLSKNHTSIANEARTSDQIQL